MEKYYKKILNMDKNNSWKAELKNHSGFNDEEILKTYLQEEIDDNDIDVGQAQSISTFFKVGEFQRDCNFKGLHYIKCEVKDTSGSVIFRDYIYVPIE